MAKRKNEAPKLEQQHLEPLSDEERPEMVRDLYQLDGQVAEMEAREKTRRDKALAAIKAKKTRIHETAKRLREDDAQKGLS